ncbi:MAG TPA: TlpA disulfide reductase family protein [Pseudobacteroides sp.]|uniref:TlpA family protein disulfide reductase n=1 Tax=Pseudobacteroides sp. TaxID=1968840 RepID=UPI002F935A8E
MKKGIIMVLCVLLAVALVVIGVISFKDDSNKNTDITSDVTSSPESSAAVSPEPDSGTLKMADDFTLTDLNGNQVTLSELKGKNVFLNFFATWCSPCKRELPDIQKIEEEYKDKDLLVYLVDLGEDENTVKEFLKKNNYTFNVLMDINSDAGNLYRTTEIPTSFFINKEGRIVVRHTSIMTYEQMKNNVEKLYK